MSIEPTAFTAPFAHALGVEFLPPAGTIARARLMPVPSHEASVGSDAVHVSVLTALLDNTCGAAVRLARTGAETPFATLDLRMDHFAPARLSQLIWAEAECYRLTEAIAYARAWVWQEDRERPLAACTATFMLDTRAGTAATGADATSGTVAGADAGTRI